MEQITIMTFGYVFGAPEEADTVIGTRGLPNPYYVDALKHKTGLEQEVRDYVFSTPEAERFFETALDLVRQRIAFHKAYDSPLKKPLVIAVGCTGGKHRSVSMAYRLAEALRADGLQLRLIHRDLKKRLLHSAGAVVFTREGGEPRYVIVQSVKGHHGFPKGRMEPGETEAQTALREIAEETGLRVRLIPGFRTAELYPIEPSGETAVYKQVVWLLAEYEAQSLRPQEGELRAAELMRVSEALDALEYESSRRVLREANTFLNHQT